MYGKLQLFHHCLIFSMNIYLVNFLLIDCLLLIWGIIYICRSGNGCKQSSCGLSYPLRQRRQFAYSWKLVPTDKTPAGKREDISLREKEKEIQKDLDDGIDHLGKKMTVCQLYAKQIRHRANVKEGTKQGRGQLMRILREDNLGACPIEKVKLNMPFLSLSIPVYEVLRPVPPEYSLSSDTVHPSNLH